MDDVQTELAGIISATLDSVMPRVPISTLIDGVLVMIVEPCLPSLDETHPVARGYTWHAVTGDFSLVPGSVESDGFARPGMAQGGQIIAESSVSPAAALTAARAALRRPGRGVPR